MDEKRNVKALDRYLSPVDVWAMAFGCMVGWGVFAMPGTTFLPIAGPAGTVISMLIGMVIMLVIGSNFAYLMGRSSITGGVYTYTKEAFGRDHAFLSCWFLCLSYLTIVFLNGTALFFIVRTLFADTVQSGFHYTIAGNEIYLGETLVSVLVLAGVGALFIGAKPLLQRLHTVLAIVLFAGIAAAAVFCLPRAVAGGALRDFGIRGLNRGYAVFSLVILAPWAYVGFEITAFDTAHFRFPMKRTKRILVVSILAAAFAYAAMALVGVASVPDGFSSWQEYIAGLDGLKGVVSVPTFYAAKSVMGSAGLTVMTVTAAAAILTGIIGGYRATTRVLSTMAEDRILSEKFSKTSYSILFIDYHPAEMQAGGGKRHPGRGTVHGRTAGRRAGDRFLLEAASAGRGQPDQHGNRPDDPRAGGLRRRDGGKRADRREQVVENNLRSKIDVIRTAVDMLTQDDLSDKEHLEAYQRRMKKLFSLDRFAFVDTGGLIYTSTGTQDNIDEFEFDYKTISEPEVSIFDSESDQRQVIIAVPVQVPFQGKTFSVCFMAIDMSDMLAGVSMAYQSSDATFSNIYTGSGMPLTDQVLGGQAAETNLLEALKQVRFEDGYSYEQVETDFAEGNRGVVSFIYGNIRETLSYVPVSGTDWFLTYLIRESVISEQISSISDGIITRSVLQTILTILVLVAIFWYVFLQNRKSARLRLEKETADAEHRVKQEEMEQRLALQDELLEQKEQGARQDRMIRALSSDYRSVYYLELDKNTGVCYQARTDLPGLKVGEKFPYLEAVTAYCNRYVTEPFREEFLKFIRPDAVMEALKSAPVISCRYTIRVDGRESWEIVKFAGVRHPDEREDHFVHTVGACWSAAGSRCT